MTAATLLPLLAWLLFLAWFAKRGFGWRSAFLAAGVAWGVVVTLLTESLSVCSALERPALASCWGAVALVAAVALLRERKPLPAFTLPEFSRIDKVIVAVIAGILATTFLIAVVSPPNNWDSLTYHMTRVMFWIEHKSVADFPTNNLRQIELNPWAEFAITHLQILSGWDYLANLVQWFSFAGSLVAAAQITGLLGGTRRAQLLSALLVATLPMAVLQSTSTQNDMVVSFFLVSLVALALESLPQTTGRAALVGCALGLAVLTKATAYLYAAPFLLWFFVRDLKQAWRPALLRYLLLATLALSLNAGHFQRNAQVFHNPLQSGTERYSNAKFGPRVLFSNLTRNLFLHLLTPSRELNVSLEHGIDSLHSALGIASNDPDTTWRSSSLDDLKFAFHEDHAGNPLHLLLVVGSLALLVLGRRERQVLPYAAAAGAGFLLFCVILRWQPWGSRLQLPIFVCFAPLSALVLARFSGAATTRWAVALFSVAALPYTLCNYSRPVIALPGCPDSICSVSRTALMFENKPARKAAFMAAVAAIKKGGFRNIGLSGDGNSWEYPFWMMTRTEHLNGPAIEHVEVQNVSAAIPQGPFRPDVVVVITNSGEVQLKPVHAESACMVSRNLAG